MHTRLDSLWLKTLYATPSSAFGTTVVGLFLFLALFGPWLAPYDASQQIAT